MNEIEPDLWAVIKDWFPEGSENYHRLNELVKSLNYALSYGVKVKEPQTEPKKEPEPEYSIRRNPKTGLREQVYYDEGGGYTVKWNGYVRRKKYVLPRR